MNRSFVIVTLALLLISCKGAQETTTTTATTSSQSTATTAPAPAPATTTTMAATESSAPPPAAAAAPSGTSLASQETNWPGVTAEVTEFRRKGNTLTAKVRLTNKGSAKANPEFLWPEVSLLDTAGGKKYEVLKDEKGGYLASNRQGWNDRWSEWIDTNQSQIVWMKFPAPPATVKTISLQLPKMPPFDDLTIQD